MSSLLESKAFSRGFEVVLNPLKFWALQPGTLFFTVHEFSNNNVNSTLFIKLNSEKCMIIELGITGSVLPDAEVYMVLKDAQRQ